MASSQNQRLRRAAEKAARRKVMVAEKRRAEMIKVGGSGGREILEASRAPVKACLVAEELFNLGIGWVVIARTLPSGSIAASFFLVDVWCLGIKDAMFATMTAQVFDERMAETSDEQPFIDLDPPVARKLLHDAAAYAASLGFRPSGEFARAESIFGAIPVAEETFSFGRDGKPYFVAGPNDSPTRARRILETLTKHTGPDGYDYMVPVDPFE